MGVFREDGTVFRENVAAAPVYRVDDRPPRCPAPPKKQLKRKMRGTMFVRKISSLDLCCSSPGCRAVMAHRSYPGSENGRFGRA